MATIARLPGMEITERIGSAGPQLTTAERLRDSAAARLEQVDAAWNAAGSLTDG